MGEKKNINKVEKELWKENADINAIEALYVFDGIDIGS